MTGKRVGIDTGTRTLEGAPIALSTMADAVGAVSTALDPLRRLVEAHVMAAERLHGDDTTVPVLAKGKTDTGRLWIYVRDDEPFGGAGPPAAMFHYSRDRRGEHPQAHLIGYAGILQADAYDGYNKLYLADRKPGPIRETLAVLAAASAPPMSSAVAQEKKPNILVIMGDDVGWFNVGAYHRGIMSGKTPNLDKLASQGMMFTHYYAEASCTAGRANFITGELPIRHRHVAMRRARADGATAIFKRPRRPRATYSSPRCVARGAIELT